MLSNHLVLCHPLLLLPSVLRSIRVFSYESALCIRWPKYWSFSLSKSFQQIFRVDFLSDWLVWSPCFRNSQESSPEPQFESINSSALNLLYGPVLISRHDYWKNHIALTTQTPVGKVMSLLSNILSTFVIAFFPRNKHLLFSWLQSLPAVTLEPKKIKIVTAFTSSSSICHKVMRPDIMTLTF